MAALASHASLLAPLTIFDLVGGYTGRDSRSGAPVAGSGAPEARSGATEVAVRAALTSGWHRCRRWQLAAGAGLASLVGQRLAQQV